MKIEPEVRKEINQVLDAMKEAVEAKNIEALVALVDSEPNILTVGPCPDNVGLGQNGFRRWMQALLDKATPGKIQVRVYHHKRQRPGCLAGYPCNLYL